jgi:hypothetical protein
MQKAHTRKMTSQNTGSALEGTTQTVASAMASPNIDKAKIRHQFNRVIAASATVFAEPMKAGEKQHC